MKQSKTSSEQRSHGQTPELSRKRPHTDLQPKATSHFVQLAAILNASPQVQAQVQLKNDIQRSPQMQRAQDLLALSSEINYQRQPSGISAGEVVQCLMQGAAFLGRYKHAGTANTRHRIGNLLTEYESAWGYGYGTRFPEHVGK
jgi:hypothetical protein